jgi:heterodisulfide reductase subunit A
VLAACSPRTLDGLFRDTVREGGLNQYYFEFANIREQCSWVHSKEKEAATDKSLDLIRMSVARAALLDPLQEFDLPVTKAALVVGGGISGMTSALSIAEQGHEVHLIEKEKELGGMARKIHSTIDGMDVKAHVDELKGKIYRNPLIRVYTEAVVDKVDGYVGNFVTTINSERGVSEIKHGVTIIAIGVDVYEPTEYLYGNDDRVMTHLELEEKMVAGDEKVSGADTVVMIQCVGCRNAERDYCSRICCQESVKNALALKEKNPDMDIYVLYRDVRTYGFNEDYYREARGKKVRFVRYVPEDAPVVEAGQKDGRSVLKVSVTDQTLQTKIEIGADLVVLAAAAIPSAQSTDVSQSFGVPLGPDGFFKEAHVKLRPVEFAADGVFLCGTAHYPKLISEAISQAYGAAGRALTMLSHDTVIASGSVCEVDNKKCIGCGACVTACTYGAIHLEESKQGAKAVVVPVLCKGCGLCNAKCPSAAIQLKHFTDDEIVAQIDTAIPELVEVK